MRQPPAFSFCYKVPVFSGERSLHRKYITSPVNGGFAGVPTSFLGPPPTSPSPSEVTAFSRHQLRRAIPHRSWCRFCEPVAGERDEWVLSARTRTHTLIREFFFQRSRQRLDRRVSIGKKVRQHNVDRIRQFVPEVEDLRFQRFASDCPAGRIGMVGKMRYPLEIPLFVRVILKMQKQLRQFRGIGQ